MTNETLAQALLEAVRAQAFEQNPDAMRNGAAMRHHPSIDLAVVAFTSGGPVAANVLFSREHPEGHSAAIGPAFSAVQGLRFDADLQDEAHRSIAWWPDADWTNLRWRPLWGNGPLRFVAPYPASVFKLMLAVGLAYCVDTKHWNWDDAFTFKGQTRPLRDWMFDMLAVSSNNSTSALTAALHHFGLLGSVNQLHQLFDQIGLPTLRLANTSADGGWTNGAGAGVGHLQMTAWDTARLLWWLDPAAPIGPWLAPMAPMLSDASRQEVLNGLQRQGLDIVLSSAALGGLPGFEPGIPAQVQPGWRQADGSWVAGEYRFPAAESAMAETVLFAHKVGNTENYSAEAGIVTGLPPCKRHYIVALFSNLGERYAPHPLAAGPWGLPKLGAAIDRFMTHHLEQDDHPAP